MATSSLDSDSTRPAEDAQELSLSNSSNPTLLLSPSATLANELVSGDPDRPIHIILVVYDLLPPGKLSNLAWYLGVGLYHSAVRIPEIGREIAFGGHAHPQFSGIFSLPIRSDGKSPMPGLRLITSVDMGQVKTRSAQASASSSPSRSSPRDEEARRLVRCSSSTRSIRPSSVTASSFHPSASAGPMPTIYPPSTQGPEMIQSTSRGESSSVSSIASSTSDSPPARTQLQTLGDILTQLDQSPEWRGTSYDLLRQNCNTFTNHFCMLLTGRHTPSWINRAASVGCAFPCLVPNEWIEPPAALAPPPPPSTPQSYAPPRQEMRLCQGSR